MPFTIGAIRKRIEAFNIDPQIREYSSNNLLTIIKKMRDIGKIKLTQHEGKTHYFIPEIYNTAQDKGEAQYFTPEVFISAETHRKKVKKEYCKRCKKEVILMYRKTDYSKWRLIFSLIFSSLYSEEAIAAHQNTGWFCPSCGNRIAVLYKDLKIIIFLSGAILWPILMIFGSITENSDIILGALILSPVIIIIAIRQLISWILNRRAKKIFDKLQDLPNESLKVYREKMKDRTRHL